MIHDVSERDPVEVLAEEFMDRHRRKERVTVDDYAKRFPDLADRIRTVFPALQLLEEFRPEVSEARQPPAIPKQLGEFRIVSFLGRGGMGVVYEAVQETLDRRVALKVLPADLARDPSFQTRFHREARMAAQLHHTNIVAVHGAGQTDGVHFLVMQLIEGASLDGVLASLAQRPSAYPTKSHSDRDETPVQRGVTQPLIEQAPPLPLPRELSNLYHDQRADYYRTIADVMAQCADALAYAHSRGVIHRDIKPGNILLARGEQSTLTIEPKITDFGLAKAEGAGDLTRSGFVVGTPRFVAPERFDGDDTSAGDVFALGATMYELLTLRHAFDAPTRERLIDQIHKTEPTRPREIVDDIPQDLETITLKALAKNPHQRYSAAALAEDLRRWLDGRPILARRVGAIERLVAWSRRNPVIAGLTAGLFLTLTTGLIASLVLWRTAETNRIAAQTHLETANAEFRRAEDNAKEAHRQQVEAEKALGQSLTALDEFYQKVSQEKLLDVPGLQPLRRDLLVSALNYYERFSSDHADDPRLRRETARALLNAGRLQNAIGTKEQARPLIERAYQAFSTLVAESPDDVEVRKGMFRTCEAMAVVLGLTHEANQSRDFFLQACRHAGFLSDNDSRYSTGWFQIRAAEIALELGNYDEALNDLASARQILSKMYQEQPDLKACLYALGRADGITANILRDRQSPESLTYARRAQESLSKLLQLDPNLAEYRRECARAFFQLAATESALGQFDDARNHFRQGRDIVGKLAEENPQVRDYTLSLANNLVESGKCERQSKNLDDARHHVDDALQILRQLEATDPADSAVAFASAKGFFERGLIASTGRQFDEALTLMNDAKDRYINLLAKTPSSMPYQCNLGSSYGNIAYFCNILGRFADGAAAARSAITLQTELLKAGPRAPRQASALLVQHFGVLFTALRNQDRMPELEAAIIEYLGHYSAHASAHVRAAREYCLCAMRVVPPVGPPSTDQVEQAERYAAMAMAMLQKALDISPANMKKDFPQPQFRILNHRPDYQAIVAALKSDS